MQMLRERRMEVSHPFRHVSAALLFPALLALPIILVVSAVLMILELRQVREVYLRNQAASVAARLELPGTVQDLETLAEEYPSLVDLRIYEQENATKHLKLEALWKGRALFVTEDATVNGEAVYRAYVPFHANNKLQIARIEIAGSSAEFLVRHTRHHLMIAGVSGLALALISVWAVISQKRAARLESQRLQLENLAQLGQMSAVLAHEIRNPVGTIKGFTQLAREQANDQLGALLEPVIDEIGRLERLVNDLLAYGKTHHPVSQTVEWPRVAADLEQQARQLIGTQGISFQADPIPLAMQTDPDLLKQALTNLIRNSVEALNSQEGGLVRVNVRNDKGLTIAVEDNGPGLPEAARDRLFEPFFTTKAFGTGLGLSIVRKVMRVLDGTLELRDLEPHGTCAEVKFPRMKTWQRS